MLLGKDINKALKISLAFIFIISIFDLLEKLCTIIPIGNYNESVKDRLDHLLRINILWLITVILIICGLCVYIKRAEGKKLINIMNNPIVSLSSGLLIIFEGMTNLAYKVSVLILNINTYREAAPLMGDKELTDLGMGISAANAIPILINLLQIVLGIYLVLKKKENID